MVARLSTPVARRRGLLYRTPTRTQARRVPLLLVQPETIFLNQVIGLAKLYGWRHYHTFDSRKSVPGFPDLVLVRGVRLIFAELKNERGRLSTYQDEWLADLRHTAAEVYVWKPADLPIIAAILRRRTSV